MQTRFWSMIEAFVNQIVGYLVALVVQILVFPFYGIDLALSTNMEITLIFAVTSTIRSYIVRRYFNGFHFKRTSRYSK